MRAAVIDIGTNSVKFCIGERTPDGRIQTLVDRADVTRLGEGLADTGVLGEEPIKRTVDAIAGMAAEARDQGAKSITAVATAGMRIASNSDVLIDAVRDRCGIDVAVISGEEEARLGYVAVVAALPDAPGALTVFETGGGSSQFTFGHGHEVDDRFSVNVGAARFTERFGLSEAVSADLVQGAKAAAAAELTGLDGREHADRLVGMGGTVTNMAAVKHDLDEYDPAVVQGSTLERPEVDRQIELYRNKSAAERREIRGLQPGRAEVILAGACIVATVMDLLETDSLTVSDRGLRHGLLAELLPE